MDLPAHEQLPLFPPDWASELGRALFDLAWLVLQSRTYLTKPVYLDLLALLANWREVLIARTHAERVARDGLASMTQRPRYGPKARPAPPPTIARLAG